MSAQPTVAIDTVDETIDATEAAAFTAQWTSWHQERLRALTAPHGFLAVTDLHWLSDEPTRLAGAPGLWFLEGDSVSVQLGDHEQVRRGNTTITGTHNFGPITEREGFNLGHGETVIEVAKRGGKYVVRPRHPQNPLLQDFTGVPAFTPDPHWRLKGVFHQFTPPRPTRVGAASEGIEHVYEAPGQIEFEVDGTPQVLTAFNGHEPGTLNVLFTDATSGKSTYAANRSLTVEAPARDGSVILDFNRALNLPCAFTDLATCPLPPAENRLAVAITAGEQTPYERSAY